MTIRKELFAGAVALTFIAGGAAYAADPLTTQHGAQSSPSTMSRETTGQATSSASQLSLTQQQKQQIFQAAQNLPKQNVQQSALTPGSKVPDKVNLSPMPQQAKQNIQNSALQNAQVAKLQNGDVIVADSNKVVQAVITQKDANSTTGAAPMNSTSSPSQSK